MDDPAIDALEASLRARAAQSERLRDVQRLLRRTEISRFDDLLQRRHSISVELGGGQHLEGTITGAHPSCVRLVRDRTWWVAVGTIVSFSLIEASLEPAASCSSFVAELERVCALGAVSVIDREGTGRVIPRGSMIAEDFVYYRDQRRRPVVVRLEALAAFSPRLP